MGLVAPLLRSLILGMPPLFPVAVAMACELAAYGAIAGLMHRALPRKKPLIYLSLLTAMIVGRLVWGAAMFLCLGIQGGSFGLAAFWAGAVVNAVPGIVAQILLVPLLVMLIENIKLFRAGELA